ncbi:MAG: alpha-galactosidase [Kiritimatiellae bacterium]|nr:alpha-galactosidase [Kiritimatiellia bacterium]
MNTFRKNCISIETPNTMLVLARRGDVWAYAHIGARSGKPEDYALLSANRPCGDSANGPATSETYPAFGSPRPSGNETFSNRYGAITVRHSDGDIMTDWRCAAAREAAAPKGASHVEIELRDKKHKGFRATQHFLAWDDCDVFETWVDISNGESGPVALSRMDSFCLQAPGLAESFHIMTLAGNWADEANVSESEIPRGQEATIGARSGVRDAWENNPAFFLSLGDRATETAGRVLGGALCWSGTWEISALHTYTHELRLRAGAANISGPYVLDAGKSITLPKFVFTWSDAGKGPASRALHRWARRHLMPHPGLRDILLNSWEGAYMDFGEKTLTDMMDGTKELGGELFVVDDGWFGRGEFARDNDSIGLGDWLVHEGKIPHGMSFLASEAKRRGLKFGLWFEPEMANTRSELLRDHPDWCLQAAGRPLRCGRGGTQVVLDMANPALRDAVFEMIDKVIRDAKGLAYIKWDANCDINNLGSPYLGPGKQGNLWFDYTQGVYALLARLRAAHPGIVFQACSSGGAHAEFGFLAHADEFWGSDNSCAQQRVFIQWGEGQFYPACAIAAHVTAVPNHQTGRMSSLKYRFDVAMSGRLGFELHPKNMTREEIAIAKRGVEAYKRLRPVVQQGDLYRLASPYETDHSALLFVSADKRHAVAFVYGLGRRCNDGRPEPLRLAGLDPERRYLVREIDISSEDPAAHPHVPDSGARVGGAALAAAGLVFNLKPGDDSAVIEFTAAR